jgi:hypothetical protein
LGVSRQFPEATPDSARQHRRTRSLSRSVGCSPATGIAFSFVHWRTGRRQDGQLSDRRGLSRRARRNDEFRWRVVWFYVSDATREQRPSAPPPRSLSRSRSVGKVEDDPLEFVAVTYGTPTATRCAGRYQLAIIGVPCGEELAALAALEHLAGRPVGAVSGRPFPRHTLVIRKPSVNCWDSPSERPRELHVPVGDANPLD